MSLKHGMLHKMCQTSNICMNKIKRTLRQTYYSDREVEFVFLIDKATHTIKTHDP
jgi:hypothetical protein